MRNAPHALMLFAAGFGTRMKHLTKTQPKPMIKVAGKPLIDHAIDLGRDAGCAPIVANLHYLPDVLEAHLAPQSVQTVTELPDILETGGGLRNALPVLGAKPVFTSNTDAVWAGPNPLRLLADAWRPEVMDALLMTVPLDHAVGHGGGGDFDLDANGALTRGGAMIYGGVQIIKTDGLADIDLAKFSLNLLWDRMLQDGRLHGLTYPGRWCDVGHPEGITLAEQMLENADV